MRAAMLVVAMLVGLVVGCDIGPLDVTNDDGPGGAGPLPGDCNNPVLCPEGGTRPGDTSGGGSGTQETCSGCVCASNPQQCRSCQIRCRRDNLNCVGSSGTSPAGCDLVYGQACENQCGGGLTCACPR